MKQKVVGGPSDILIEMIEGFEVWKDKVGHKEFLKSTLEEISGEILDAALGLGGDAVFLAGLGLNIVGNDIDPFAVQRAKENVRKNGVRFPITEYDWKDFHKYFNNRFGGVLCIGNSLTYLFSRKEQLGVLGNFRNSLREEGVLIVDERNFQYMFDHSKEIRQGKFKYPGIYKLSEDHVKLVPIGISRKEVKMQARSKQTGHVLDIKFYPFKRNELLGLLRETGFSKIEQYSDYFPGFNPNADFYQYVCVK